MRLRPRWTHVASTDQNRPSQRLPTVGTRGADELAWCGGAKRRCRHFAEGQAMRRVPMHMGDWIRKLHDFLTLNDRDILTHAGRISRDL